VKIEEHEIPERIRQGTDNEVVKLLYKRVFPLVQNYITKRSGKKEDAYDVFQDAVMVFYKQVMNGSFNPQYKVYGYLFRISINYWINKLKKDKRLQYTDELEDSQYPAIETRDELFISGRNENLLRTLFSNIGEKCIELLHYTIYSEILMEDIMIRMGFSSVSAVKMQQLRCKQKLVQEMEKNPQLAERLKNI
jgi:RNA polymerase sigma factor (sigma-70 family)